MRRRNDGFSLLEILVAFSILSVGLGVLMQIFSTSLTSAERVREETALYSAARNLLATVQTEKDLSPGERRGNSGETIEWTLGIAPVDNPLATGASSSELALWLIEARVAKVDKSQRVFVLRTLLVKPVQKQS